MALSHIGQSLCRPGDKLCTMFNFIQFVVYSMRNPVVYRTAKKVCFADYVSCYVSLIRHSIAAANST